VSGNYFSTLGVGMARGRGFRPDEDRVDDPQAVAVLNYQTWQTRFGADPNIVGRLLRLDEIAFTVVGVASPDFAGTDPNRSDFWVPFPARLLLRPHDPSVRSFLTSPDHCCSPMAGRLAPGYTRAQGAAEVALLAGQFRNQSERESGHAIVANGTAMLQASGRKKRSAVSILVAMFTAITLVLLLACANVGNLLLARAAARRTEIAVRLSLGGSRLRLIRQLLVESLALAASAAVIGLAIAWVAPAAILARAVPENAIRIRPDLTVCAYTAGIAVLACLAFGLAPALHGTRDIAGALKSDARSTGHRFALRGILLAAQVAISVVLLAAAGLLVRGLQHAQRLDPGFRVSEITIATLDLPASAYSGPRAATFTAQFEDALSSASGLPPLAVTSDAPMANSRDWTSMRPSELPPDRDKMVQFHEITGAYFDVLGIPIVAGRNFTRDDTRRQVAIVNETAVNRFWNGVNPVGKTIASNQKLWEVVGVARDAHTTGLDTIEPTMYWPMVARNGIPQLLIAGATPAVRDRIAGLARQLDSKARVTFTPLSDNLRSQLEPSKYAAAIAGALGFLALALASIGMSGVFAYAVRQRTREIGVRMALGAQPAQVVRLVLGANLHAVAWGLAIGVAGAAAASKLLRPLMIGASPFDPLAYLAMFGLLAVAAAAASFLPARRAAGVDPVTALRWE